MKTNKKCEITDILSEMNIENFENEKYLKSLLESLKYPKLFTIQIIKENKKLDLQYENKIVTIIPQKIEFLDKTYILSAILVKNSVNYRVYSFKENQCFYINDEINLKINFDWNFIIKNQEKIILLLYTEFYNETPIKISEKSYFCTKCRQIYKTAYCTICKMVIKIK